MATLEEQYYLLEDWGCIRDSYSKYITHHTTTIDKLHRWLTTQPHLPRIHKNTLAMMYHWAGESLEETKTFIDNYFTHRTKHPQFFKNRCADFKAAEAILDLVEVATIEPWVTTIKNKRLVYVRLVDNDANKLDFHLGMQVYTSAVDFEIARQGLIGTGVVIVLDMEGVHFGYIPKVNLMDLAVTLKYSQMFEKQVECIHIINCNGLISQVMTLIRPFLSKDLANKFYFYKENEKEDFFKRVPKEHVPSTYGGRLDSMPEFNAQFRKRFKTSEKWLKSLEGDKWQVKEHLRPLQIDSHEKLVLFFKNMCID